MSHQAGVVELSVLMVERQSGREHVPFFLLLFASTREKENIIFLFLFAFKTPQ